MIKENSMAIEMWNCPFCGFELDKRAKSCPQCGSDKDTGWKQDTYQEEHEHDYEAAMKHEFDLHHKVKKDWKVFLITMGVLSALLGLLIKALS